MDELEEAVDEAFYEMLSIDQEEEDRLLLEAIEDLAKRGGHPCAGPGEICYKEGCSCFGGICAMYRSNKF